MELKWTGERLIPDFNLGKGVLEHLHRYALALEFVENKIVLDIASGEGYGTNLLATKAKFIYGVDISDQAIMHATSKYNKENLLFKVGSVTKIPLPNDCVDVVTCFETLEHLTQQTEMMFEIKRVLKENGLLIISTPERDNYQKVDPNNKFHVKELTGEEFRRLIQLHFKYNVLCFQNFVYGGIIIPEYINISDVSEYSGNFELIDKANFQLTRLFNIAVCSDNYEQLEKVSISYFSGNSLLETIKNTEYKNGYADALRVVRNSRSYKLGNYLLKPINYIIKRIK